MTDESEQDLPDGSSPRRRDGFDTSTDIRRALDGNTDSWSRVVARFSPLMEELARLRSGSDAAEIPGLDPGDVVHEVWSRILPRLRSLPETATDGSMRTALRNYLARSVINRIIDVRRTETRRRLHERTGTASEQVPCDRSGPLSAAMQADATDRLRKALQALPERERAVLVMSYLEGRSSTDIAAELGLSASHVRRLGREGRDWLRRRLAEIDD